MTRLEGKQLSRQILKGGLDGNALQLLAEHGQSRWIDYLSRPFVRDGNLAELVREGIAGVATAAADAINGALTNRLPSTGNKPVWAFRSIGGRIPRFSAG